jgi:hypothetical protein
MIHHVVSSLIMPAPIVTCAQLNRHGQMLDTATVGTPLPVNLNIVTSLRLPGNIRRCMGGLRTWLHHQRWQGTRLNGFGGLDRSQGLHFQTSFRDSDERREAGYDLHDFNPPQPTASVRLFRSRQSSIHRPPRKILGPETQHGQHREINHHAARNQSRQTQDARPA